MKKTAHTPWPWESHRFGGRREIIAARGTTTICVVNDLDGIGHANAEFIARACNCHDDLLELVRSAHDRFTDNDMQPPNNALKQWIAAATATGD